MKYIKTYEDRKLKPEEKEGNKVARTIKNLINKIFYIKDYLELYEVSYNSFNNFNYDFVPQIFIEFNKDKDTSKLDTLKEELDRLNCKDPRQLTNYRRNFFYQLTKFQVEELLLTLKNGLPFQILNKDTIDPNSIYTYINLERAFKSTLFNDDYITGELYLENNQDITIKGLTRNHKAEQKSIKNNWVDHMKYVRLATNKEKEDYYSQKSAIKFNI